MWTHVLRSGREARFRNPLMQNLAYIEWLRHLLPEINENAFRSVVVFGKRCNIGGIELTTDRHRVISESKVLNGFSESAGQSVLTDDMIEAAYYRLYPLTQFCNLARIAHIDEISKRDTVAHVCDTIVSCSEEILQHNLHMRR